jgi:branched-chain amino acid transport system substrate-binding protein
VKTPAIPLRIGLLHDYPPNDGGKAFERVVMMAFEAVNGDGRLPGTPEFVHVPALGLPLPGGTAHSVEQAWAKIEAEGVLAVLGPAITDNAIIAAELADRDRLSAINYAGSHEGRSNYMFHFQLGSLEEEPSFLLDHLKTQGVRRVALIQDTTHIGHSMTAYFERACGALGIELTAHATINPDGSGAERAITSVQRAEPEGIAFLGLWDAAHEVALARTAAKWDVPVVGNSALIYGHVDAQWANDWEGWVYPDTFAETNPYYAALAEKVGAEGIMAGSAAAAHYDMGVLLAEGFVRAPHLTRSGVHAGLERVKALPAATGHPDTLMGFGIWERSALKGHYLVVRAWRGGKTVLV